MKIFDHIKAFITGMYEYRSQWTKHFDPDLIESYDKGRELAHIITQRKYEQ